MIGLIKNMLGMENTQLTEAIKQGAFLIDVRTPAEFAGGSAAGAGRALAARGGGQELGALPGHPDHARGVVDDDEPGGAQAAAGGGEGLVGEGDVEVLGGDGRGRHAGEHGLDAASWRGHGVRKERGGDFVVVDGRGRDADRIDFVK